MILEIVEDFDITTFEGLVDNFRIEAVGCHPDPETLIEFLTEWGNSINQKVNKIFSFNFYARLLRWCITEGGILTLALLMLRGSYGNIYLVLSFLHFISITDSKENTRYTFRNGENGTKK